MVEKYLGKLFRYPVLIIVWESLLYQIFRFYLVCKINYVTHNKAAVNEDKWTSKNDLKFSLFFENTFSLKGFLISLIVFPAHIGTDLRNIISSLNCNNNWKVKIYFLTKNHETSDCESDCTTQCDSCVPTATVVTDRAVQGGADTTQFHTRTRVLGVR